MFGYSATGSWTIATTPTMTMRMEMTMATMGRLMKNLAMVGLLRRRARLGGRGRRQPNLLAGAYPVASLDDDPLAGLQPLRHRPERANPHVDLDRADVNRIVGADHRDLVDALHVLDGALRDQERGLLHLDDGANLRVLAGPQQISRVRKHRSREHGAAGNVHLSVESRCAPRVGIDGAVGQNQLQLEPLGLARVRRPPA